MSRVLVLVAALILFRSMLARKRSRSLTAVSPYMNALDGAISAEQLSVAMEEFDKRRQAPGRFRSLH
jgi:hypothetical protein